MTPAQKILQEKIQPFEEYLSLIKAVSCLPQEPQTDGEQVFIPREMWEKFRQSLKGD